MGQYFTAPPHSTWTPRGLDPFHMEWGQSTWIPHGMEFSPHGFHMEWSSVHMDSTWNGVQSTWIPHGMVFSPHGFHMEWSSVHMDSTWNGVQSTWIPHGMEFSPHGFHMEGRWPQNITWCTHKRGHLWCFTVF